MGKGGEEDKKKVGGWICCCFIAPFIIGTTLLCWNDNGKGNNNLERAEIGRKANKNWVHGDCKVIDTALKEYKGDKKVKGRRLDAYADADTDAAWQLVVHLASTSAVRIR